MWVVSGVVLVLGCVGLGFGAWDSVFGMDFKGGYALTLDSDVCEYNPEQMCSVLRKRFQQSDYLLEIIVCVEQIVLEKSNIFISECLG